MHKLNEFMFGKHSGWNLPEDFAKIAPEIKAGGSIATTGLASN